MITMFAILLTVISLFAVTLMARVSTEFRLHSIFRRLILRRWQWLMLCMCFSFLFCVACGGTDAVFTVIFAALDGVGIVVTGLGALISPGEATIIEGAMSAIGDLVGAVQAAWDTFEADPSAAGALAGLQAAVTKLQGDIPGILAELNITNPTLQAWITTIIGLVGKLAADIAADILPKLEKAATAHAAGDDVLVKELTERFNELKNSFIVAHNAALDESGLPPETIVAVHKSFDKATHTSGE